MTVVASGCVVAIHVSQTAKTSSPKLKAQLLSGSGVVLTAARALAFVPCEVSATPPARSAAAHRHSAGAAPAAPYASSAAAGGRMKVCIMVYHVPHSIDVRDFVRKKFHKIQNDSDRKNRGMCKRVKRRRKVDDSETLEEPQCCDGRVKIQA
jgi:hypothetical protein